MAIQVERMVAILEARLDKYEKGLAKALGTTNRQFTAIERRGKQMESRMSQLGANFSRGFLGALAGAASIRGAQQLIDAATRIQNALKVAGLSGEELTKVYDRLFESAQKNAAPLESLVTLYGRAAIVQKELGVSTEELLGFTNNVALALRVAGTDASTASGALLQLSQALGSGVVRAEEFNSILEGALPIAQAAAAGLKEAGGSVAALRALVVDGKVSSEAFFRAFEAGSVILEEKVAGSELTVSQAFVRLQNVLIDTAGHFNDSVDASGNLARFMENTLIPAIQELGGVFSWLSTGPVAEFIGYINAATDAVLQMSADLGAATGLDEIGRKFGAKPFVSQGRVQDRIDDAFAGTAAPKGPRKPLELTVDKGTVVKPVSLADYAAPTKAGKGRGSRNKRTAADRFNEDLQSVRDRTAALLEEQNVLGLTFKEQEKRKVSLDLELQALKDLREEARRKGVTDLDSIHLSQTQKQRIDEVSEAYANQAEALRKATEMQDLERDVLKGGFDDVRSALEDGKITMQEWGDIALNVLDKVVDKIENDLIDSILQANKAGSGGGGGGIFDWISKGIGALFGGGASADPWAGLRLAEGGKVSGPGGPTGDKIPAMLSDGEHVTRAAMAKKYGPLLNAINADRLPKFAEGGWSDMRMPSIPQISAPSSTPAITVSPVINVDARNAQQGVGPEIEAAIKRATKNMTPMVVKALKEIKVKGIPV